MAGFGPTTWDEIGEARDFAGWTKNLEKFQDVLMVGEEDEEENALNDFLSLVYIKYECKTGGEINFQDVRPWLDMLLKPTKGPFRDAVTEHKARREKWIRWKDVPLRFSTFYRAYIELSSTDLTLYLAREVLELPDSELYALIVDLLSHEFTLTTWFGGGPHTTPEDWIERGVSPVGLFEAICRKAQMKPPEDAKNQQMFDVFINYLLDKEEVVRHVLKHGDPKQKTGFGFIRSAVQRCSPLFYSQNVRVFTALNNMVLTMLSASTVHQLVEAPKLE